VLTISYKDIAKDGGPRVQKLQSYLGGKWVEGSGDGAILVNPATDEPVARSTTEGLDLASALAHARQVGGSALRALTFAQRAEILRALADTIVQHRTELLTLSTLNNGATRSDSKFDVDGASFTLQAYADLGESLGDRRYIVDGETDELLRSKRLAGLHVKTPRHGVAVHVNAFNFPAWGMAEKMAVSLLAGMPVFTKPATATALTSWRMAQTFVESGALPQGAFSFLAGSAGDLVDQLRYGDVLAFTGSGALGTRFKSAAHLAAAGIGVNVEADSLNSAVLGPDVEPGSDTWDLFIRDVFRDLHQKSGQKCTAIRRVMVPESMADEVAEALIDAASSLKIGNPATREVRMGPVVNRRQQEDVLEGLERLGGHVQKIHGSARPTGLIDVADGAGSFVGIHLFKALDAGASMNAGVVHDVEVFGPSTTILPYDGSSDQAAAMVALGKGGLVSSVYTDDRRFAKDLILELAPHHGRLTLGSAKIADSSPGPGTVLPQLVHGGPGRAGGGEELGGIRGLDFYLQRTALQGYRPLLERLFDGS
jgi:3,4-dehydroadipyl-CoA semialdehyde dehydrogenase